MQPRTSAWHAFGLTAGLLLAPLATHAGLTQRVGEVGVGQYGADVSNDGRWILWTDVSTATVYDRFTERRLELPAFCAGCGGAVMTPSGRFVVAATGDGDVVPGDTNGEPDVFLWDRDANANGVLDEPGEPVIERVSVGDGGTELPGESRRPAVSDDGRFVSFTHDDSVFLRDRSAGTTVIASRDAVGTVVPGGSSQLSADGGILTFGNNSLGWVRRNLATNGVTLLDDLVPQAYVPLGAGVHLTGNGAGYAIVTDQDLQPGDTNGDYDLYFLDAGGALVHATIPYDPALGDLIEGTDGSTAARYSSVSADGVRAAFAGKARNLVPAADVFGCGTGGGKCNDVFVYDRDLDADGVLDEAGAAGVVLASASTSGVRGDRGSDGPSLSANGRFIAFRSFATNLDEARPGYEVGLDGNLFLRDLTCGNGRLDANEACDDGNLADGDGCDSLCVPTACGNFVVTAGEQCDDGNQAGADGCEADCTIDPAAHCRALGRYAEIACRLNAVNAPQVCGDAPADQKLESQLEGVLQKASALVARAESVKPGRRGILVRRALRRLTVLLNRKVLGTRGQRLTAECRDTAGALLDDLRVRVSLLLNPVDTSTSTTGPATTCGQEGLGCLASLTWIRCTSPATSESAATQGALRACACQ